MKNLLKKKHILYNKSKKYNGTISIYRKWRLILTFTLRLSIWYGKYFLINFRTL